MKKSILLFTAILALASGGFAQTGDLVTNGGFEAGGTLWTQTNIVIRDGLDLIGFIPDASGKYAYSETSVVVARVTQSLDLYNLNCGSLQSVDLLTFSMDLYNPSATGLVTINGAAEPISFEIPSYDSGNGVYSPSFNIVNATGEPINVDQSAALALEILFTGQTTGQPVIFDNVSVIAECHDDYGEPTPLPTGGENPTKTPTITKTSIPTNTPEVTPTPTDTETPTITETPMITETPTPTVTPTPTEAVPVKLWANAHPSVLVVTETNADAGIIEVRLLGSGGENLSIQSEELTASLIQSGGGKEMVGYLNGPYPRNTETFAEPWFQFIPRKGGIVRIRFDFQRSGTSGRTYSLSAEAQFTVRRESPGQDKIEQVTNPEGTSGSGPLLRRTIKSTKYNETLQ